ncbi:MAG: LVIVD repeat-containing protein [Spirosomataceae bacterium]
MKKVFLPYSLFLLIGLVLLITTSCQDKCTSIRTYKRYIPTTISLKDLPKGISTQAPQAMMKPGKIYAKDNYLFVIESGKGIHIIDNTNASSPTTVSFLAIPGNGDMAIKDNYLYVDNYSDLVVLDISNPKAIKEAGRSVAAFPYSLGNMSQDTYWYLNSQNQTIVYYQSKLVTDTVTTNCGGEYGGGVMYDAIGSSGSGFSTSTGAPTSTGTGTGGSMARFTIYDTYLYATSMSELLVYDIKNQTIPQNKSKISLGWGAETIFPYKDKLFIGSNTGMYIFDNAKPEAPVRLSTFSHARACDPVVVDGNTAYVTLRTGTCGNAPNQLLTVDVSNLTSPVLLKSLPMQHPFGLGIDFPNLFVCEGEYGLKSMDASNPSNVTLLQQISSVNAYDVIILGKKRLLMVGKGGLYQYDYTDPKNLKQLSVISVNN